MIPMQAERLTFDIKPNANPMPEADRLKAFENLGFGTLFSDHMAVIRWNADNSRSIRPAACCITPRKSSRA